MSELTVIRCAADNPKHVGDCQLVHLSASRATLAKRRWRGVATDGKEFGFDLDEPLGHNTLFHTERNRFYVTDQLPEEVLEIPLTTLEEAARVVWRLGNLHFGIQLLPNAVRVTEDPAVVRMLEGARIVFRRVSCVFLPLSVGDHHHHHHHD
jgi:urease accessory protein